MFILTKYDSTNLFKGRNRIYDPVNEKTLAQEGNYIISYPDGVYLCKKGECYPVKAQNTHKKVVDLEDNIIDIDEQLFPCNYLDDKNPIMVENLGEIVFHF